VESVVELLSIILLSKATKVVLVLPNHDQTRSPASCFSWLASPVSSTAC
jgi:hypothetical protein